tara:strand:+ start:109 stop:423 length:315 start_codon:yes stop_codon:yes gene_type:complete
MEHVPVITIDGPSGAGKGTISQMLALDLGWNILDSGALYRSLAYYFEEEGLKPKDLTDNLEKIKNNFNIHFDAGIPGEPVKIFFQNKDITDWLEQKRLQKQLQY